MGRGHAVRFPATWPPQACLPSGCIWPGHSATLASAKGTLLTSGPILPRAGFTDFGPLPRRV
jgi:hypothetical protein